MTYPAIIILLAMAAFLFGSAERLLLLWGSVIAFGALALLPPEAIGGFNLLPTTGVALALIAKAASDQKRAPDLVRLAFELDAMILLTIFMFIAVISSVLYPRLFQGQVQVVPMRGDHWDLEPTMANFAQLGYVVVSCLTAIVVRQMAERPRVIDYFLKGLLIGGAMLTITGLISLIMGSQAPLVNAAFKTAKYTYLEGSEVAGFRRVDGFMTEASAFGGTSVAVASVLLFLGAALKTGLQRSLAKLLAWALVGMAIVSTSTSAYVGLVVLLSTYGVWCVVRAIQGRTPLTARVVIELSATFVAVLVGFAAVILHPELLDQPRAMMDVIFFKKMYSSSYYDRSLWNKMALQALSDTWGIGVGVGSARTSNWLVSVVSNTGVLGGLAMLGFIARLLFARASRPELRDLVGGLKLVILVNFVPQIMATTTPDFGVMTGIEFGLLAAFTASALRRGQAGQRQAATGLRPA